MEHLKTLRVPFSEEEFDELAAQADREQLGALEFLRRFLSLPARQRRERSIERRIREARFRYPATLENFDWKFNEKTLDPAVFQELAGGDFVRRTNNLVFVGESGLGKSHLIQAIGRCCCAAGYRVRYVTSAGLLEDLQAAAGDRTLPKRVRYYSRFDLLVIDEFGFERIERQEHPEAASLLFKIIDARTQRGSTALVTNVEFEAWTGYLNDPPLAMALLDRIVDGAIIHRFKGKSYRAHRAAKGSSASKKSGGGS